MDSEVQHGWMFGVIVYGPSQQTRLGFRELFYLDYQDVSVVRTCDG